jgi:hypothetical protein
MWLITVITSASRKDWIMDAQSHDQFEKFASSQRRLVWAIRAQWVVIAVLLVVFFSNIYATGENDGNETTDRLRVKELVVVDKKGIERIRIGGDLPDAVIAGKRIPRGEKAAGILLYDGTGQERGGYVTWEPSGNVGLTLDSRKGQVTLFVAGPERGSALKLWDGEGSIELRSDSDGSRLTAVREGQVVFQEPAVDVLGDEACAAYREALSSYSMEEVMRACRQRYSEAACRACLEKQ